MTTCRELMEADESFKSKEFFEKQRGNVPMCCFSCKKEKGILLFSCSWLKEFYPFEEFTVKCLDCQRTIQEYFRKKK